MWAFYSDSGKKERGKGAMHEAGPEPAFYDFHTARHLGHHNYTNDFSGGTIIQYSSPVILLFGLTGNGIVLLFVHKKRGHSQAFDIYFAAMTIADTLTLVFALTLRWIDCILSLDLHHWLGKTCIVVTWINQTCFNASSLFLAAMTAQRARSVLSPFTSKSGKALRDACCVITFITLCSMALHLYLLCYNDIDQGCYLGGVKDSFRKRAEGQRWRSWIIFVSIFALPFAVMIVSDVLLTWRVNSSAKKVGLRMDTSSACKGSVVQGKPSVKDRLWLLCTSNALTLTMMSTSLAFLALVGPTFLVQALVNTGALSEHSVSHITHNALDQLFFAKSGTNFYFYLLTGRHFRERLRKMSFVQKLNVINYWSGLNRVAKRQRLVVTDSMSPEEKRRTLATLRWTNAVDKLVEGESSSNYWTPTVGLDDSSDDSPQSPVSERLSRAGEIVLPCRYGSHSHQRSPWTSRFFLPISASKTSMISVRSKENLFSVIKSSSRSSATSKQTLVSTGAASGITHASPLQTLTTGENAAFPSPDELPPSSMSAVQSVKSVGNVLWNLVRSQEPSSAPTAQSCSAKTNSGSQPSFEPHRRSRSLDELQTVPGGESSFTLLRGGLSDAFDARRTSLGSEGSLSMPQIFLVNTLSVIFLPSGIPSADPMVDGDIHVSFGSCEQPEELEQKKTEKETQDKK